MVHYAEIDARFTAIVQQYLAAGYSVNTGTMSGVQNEKAKLDLTNGKEIIRVLVCSITGEPFHGESIIVGRVRERVPTHLHSNITMCDVWNEKLEVIDRENFYLVGCGGHDGKDYVYGTKEEALAAEKLRRQRSNVKDELADQTYLAVPSGWQSVAADYIRRVCRKSRIVNSALRLHRDSKGRHIVSYRGALYCLR